MDPQLPEGYPWPIYQYTWLIAISAFACGFTIAGMGPAILYIPTSIPLSTAETTMMVSVVLFGALPGTFAAGWLGDRWGRRPVIIASEILGAISTTCMALSQQSWQLIVAHGMAGIALGAFSVCAGLFSAETSPPELRGSLSGYGQLAGWVGGIMAYLFGLLLIFTVAPDLTWRLIFGGAALCFVSAAIVLVWLLPESPRWLIHRGRDNDALKILHRIYGVGREHQAHSEYQIIKAYVEDTGKQPQSYRDFGKQENRRPLVMALLLYALHQLSGNNMITFYSSIILHELGLTAEMSILATVLLIIPQALIIWFIVHNMDKIGRRKPLLVSMFGTGISLVLLAAMVQINHVHVSIAFSIVAILLNRIFFSVGLGTLPPVVAAEILPFSIRGRGLAAASALGEVIRIISVVSFLPISRSLHPSLIYAALACIMFAGFGGMMALLRETKGLSMDVLHIDSVPPSPP